MQKHGYSVLIVKSIDEEQRVIHGIATTPSLDRVGDSIDPMGASFAPDIPLLWQHRNDQPVGRAQFGKPTKDGIPFTANIPKVDSEGTLRERVEEAWQSVKYGLVRAVSVGFRVLDGSMETLKGGGLLFTKTEIMELSLVTIPANSDAVITAIKQFDQQHLPANGNEGAGGEQPASREVATQKAGVIRLRPIRKHQLVRISK